LSSASEWVDDGIQPSYTDLAGNLTLRIMAVSRRLPQNLRTVLGAPAEDELVTILDELRAENAEFRREVERRFDAIDKRFERLEDRFDTRLVALETRVADVKSDLMKWSFVFWCGAVLAVAALAGVLRQ
jgi:hypothetical protein